MRAPQFLIAPDKFKGTLSAREAAEAIARGVRRAHPDAEVLLMPIADGGEGTAEILGTAWNAERRNARVTGPGDAPVEAPWWIDPSGRAVFDSAAACGLWMVQPKDRAPGRLTTRGVGEMIRACVDAGAREVWVALGGSATVDGGIGMAAALGWRFIDSNNHAIDDPRGDDLSRIARAEPDPALQARVVGICDVVTELTGPHGCAATYGPQKGTGPADVQRLDQGLTNLRRLMGGVRFDGEGSAGGLGFGLAAFCGAKLERGARLILDAIGFDRAASASDLVITGEGAFDATSFQGKATGEVLSRCAALGVRALVVAGRVDTHRSGLHAVTCDGHGDPAQRLEDATAAAITGDAPTGKPATGTRNRRNPCR